MNTYQKVLVALNEASSRKVMVNKLVKLSVQTEDVTLKDLLDDMIFELRHFLMQGQSYTQSSLAENTRLPLSHQASVERTKRRKQLLTEYCDGKVASQKPEWQVLAERHGWKPAK